MNSTPAVIDWLMRPQTHGDESIAVERIDTDESVVVLAGNKAYKVFLPIRNDERDLSTQLLREKALQRELRLNRRLGGDIYEDVIGLYETPEGWSLEGTDPPAEFALRMKRLPADRMMRAVLASGALAEEDLDSLGDLLAEFYSSAKPVPRPTKQGVTDSLESSVRQATSSISEILPNHDLVAMIEPALLLYLARHSEPFEKRWIQGKIRECHGDLTIEHLCLVQPPIVIGSVDTKDRPRQIDVLSDLAVLLVDTEWAGFGDVGWRVWQRLASRLQEPVDQPLLFFYRSFRAFLSARREALRATPRLDVIGRWLEIAAHHARAIHQPRLFVTVGLMGTGKTTLAEALNSELGLTRLSSEELNKSLFPVGKDGKAKANRLDPEQRDRVYGELLRQVDEAMAKGISVVVDASYLNRRHREDVLDHAARAGVLPTFLECRLSKSETIARLDRRYKKNRTRPGSRPELYEDQTSLYEPPDELPAQNVIVLNMNQPVPRLVEIIRESL